MTSSYRLIPLTEPPTWQDRPLSGRSLGLSTALADSQDARVNGGALIETLWPDDAPVRPLRVLRVIVSRLRAVMGEDVVECSGNGYRLELAEAKAGVRDLSERVECARAYAATGQWEQVLNLTDRLSQMPVLGETDDNGGAGAAPMALLRERAAVLIEGAHRDWGFALEAAGEYGQAANLLREASRRDGGDEAALAILMCTESWVRSPAAALKIYKHYHRRLCELGAVPGPAARAIHEAVLTTKDPVRHGLQLEPEHFLGCEADVADVFKALSTHRLMTLIDPGEVGKTTLAQVVVARSRRSAVYVVALAEVSPGAGLARVVLGAIGGSAVINGDPHRDLAATLSQPGTILMLGSYGHLASEAAGLIEPLLVACPDPHALATSRHSLDPAAEHVHRLEVLDAASSTELFHACVLAVRPGQVIDDDDLGELLSRLEGIPLATEPAVVHTRSLLVGQVAERLPGRLDLLTAARDAPARQRALTAIIDWSWNLLDTAERRTLIRLTLFADGSTLLPVEALIGAQTVDLLDALVSHSLLVVYGYDLPRFHMLVTVRNFVPAQLSTFDDEAEAHVASRQWAVDLCPRTRFPVDAGDFGDVHHPGAHRHNCLFRQVSHDEAVILR